jgi:O-antigen ligase
MALHDMPQVAVSAGRLDRARLLRLADQLAVALVISLPWSTTATGIIAALWLLALVPALDPAALRRVLATPAGALPALLWAAAAAGMLWADVTLAERIAGLGPYHKLLCIPLLMAQFERSERAPQVMAGFVASCALLLLLSFLLVLFPSIPWRETAIRGVPVKNYAAQSELFIIAAFLAAELARTTWRKARHAAAAALALLTLALLANVLLLATTRTALVVIPILFLLFGFRCSGLRGISMALGCGVLLAGLAWATSPFLQHRVTSLATEINNYQVANERSSAAERLEFWRKSLGFIVEAPVFGHGTGSITDRYRRAAIERSGVSAVVTANPHNQTLAVAIQLGLFGTIILLALWVSHLQLFGGTPLWAWGGMIVVVQNLIGSLFNSNLFDFTHGWAYVIGVGVCGGLALAAGAAPGSAPAANEPSGPSSGP